MPRLYLPNVQPEKKLIAITGEKAHYLASVLRCQKGDELVLFDGDGNCFRTTITKSDRQEVIAEVLEEFTCDFESPLNIILMQGLLKGEKMDTVVQKATELGVREIVPLITERSQIRETRKIQRWRKIAEEAAKQSGRSMVPVIHEPAEFRKMFSEATFKYAPLSSLGKGGRKGGGIIFYEEGGMRLSEAVEVLKMSGNTVSHPLVKGGKEGFVVIIGPEGGFTKEEVACAEEKGLIVTSLGKRTLRAETAAIAAISLTQFLLGDMG
jgi:16S rRNA (uracil1498-N3)-methyltransferase